VQDCIDAILTVVAKAQEPVNVVNLGADEYCQVDNSLGWICERLGLNPKVNHTGGQRGWIGDSPFIFLDTAKLKSFGWRQKLSIRDAVIRTLDYLRSNPWVLEARKAA
jgi:UDP-glucose 4-epimerase